MASAAVPPWAAALRDRGLSWTPEGEFWKDRGDLFNELSDVGALFDDREVAYLNPEPASLLCMEASGGHWCDAHPDAAAWCGDVYALFNRTDPSAEPPHPYLWTQCAHFLLRHSFRVDAVTAALPRVNDCLIGEAALLAMEYAPGLALGLLRRALRSRIPGNRATAAAVLTLIDQPWSREEMLNVLRESDEQELTCECRAGLESSRDIHARQAVQDWEQVNPHEPEVGRFITIGEMMLRDRHQWLDTEMDRLRERVMPFLSWEPPKE